MGNKLVLYMHAGSGNHGCEAIVNSLCHMIKEDAVLVSYRGAEDGRYSLKDLCEICQERSFGRNKAAHMWYYAYRMLTGDRESFIRYRYHEVFKRKPSPLAVSIGGDNYCYGNMLNDLRLSNSAFNKRGTKTLLLGCSIEPELLKDRQVVDDLSKYRAIIARESITYGALKEAFGLAKDRRQLEGEDRTPALYCYPDPAFVLGRKELPLPAGFEEKNTVGVNVSPMIQENEKREGITMENYRNLIRFIIEHTDMQVALIPHVVWEQNDDRKPLRQLYECFKNTHRVIEIRDCGCEELKGYIGRCRLFVGARTHATIAAYSSMVPTLAAGYSVKARGIARDLFGREENYVIPVQSLAGADDLTIGFKWLLAREKAIEKRLKSIMPKYQDRAFRIGEEVDKLWEELSRQQGI